MAKPEKNVTAEQVTDNTNDNEIKTSTQKQTKTDAKKLAKAKKTKKQNDSPKKNLAKESVAELKKVTWPTFGEVVKNTLIVLGIVIICTAVLFLIDRVLSWIYQLLIDGSVTNWWF